MESPEPFSILDCSLVRCATGRRCSNLRELLEAIRVVPDGVIEHHMMRCALEDHFELHEFPNDLARWCWTALGDATLGEQLGLVDPYHEPTTQGLRAWLVNAIEDRLWSTDIVPWCRKGLEIHLVDSRLIAYDTGERAHTPAALREAIERMSPRSVYFHVHEARRRNAGRSDDFSRWLERWEGQEVLVARLRRIDFYFLNLSQLRASLLDAFQQSAQEAPPISRGPA